MAKTKQEKTAAMIAADKAREAHTKAKEANEKNDNAVTQKALATAKEALGVAVKAENRERFLSIGTRRTKKARATIRQLVKVANAKHYDYTADEANKIVAALTAAVNEVKAAFTSTSGAAADDFSLTTPAA